MNQKSINAMSIKELVVCKFKGCTRVYNDARILPCGNRTCATHIKEMILTTAKTDADTKMLKCHFCQTIHNIPDDGKGFPVDNYIPHLLNMSYSCEHDAAKKSFNEVTHLLDKMTKLNKEECAIEYFERVEGSIHKLIDFYEALVDDVHKRKVKCLQALKTNKTVERELEAIKKKLTSDEIKSKRDNLDFALKTLDGDETKWKDIQAECNSFYKTMRSHEEELKEKIVGEFVSDLRQSTVNAQFKKVCSTLSFLAIESTIISNGKLTSDLVSLCKLRGKQFKLIYRASRDGFEAASFHAKCDNKPNTLTIVKTTNGCIFGGYTALVWGGSDYLKVDPTSFIFSLVNRLSKPMLIPIKANQNSIPYLSCSNGPTFGQNDFCIVSNSNMTPSSFSYLGQSYDFKLFSSTSEKSCLFLADSLRFQTSEIEVFQLSSLD